MKKRHILAILILIVCFLFMGYAVPGMAASDARQAELASGTCGDQLTWVLTDDGTLTISGTGDMYHYARGAIPWWPNRMEIKYLVIGDGVTGIGDHALYYCTELTGVTIPDSVMRIGEGALMGCGNLTTVIIGNGVTSIGRNAFNSCSELTSIVIPDSVTSIGDYAFSECEKLAELTMPNSLTTISSGMFAGCFDLTRVIIPAGVTTIGDAAFSGCLGLIQVIVSDNVTSIGNEAFRGCQNLTCVTIPDSVISIGIAAFSNCNNLWHVLYTGTQAQRDKIEFLESAGNSYACLLGATWHYEWAGQFMVDAENMHCDICLPVCSHQWDGGTIIKEPTCIDAGQFQKTCVLCGETENTTIPETGVHTFGEWEYDDAMYHCQKCLDCDMQLTEAHVWDDGLDTMVATCTEDGLRTYTCISCIATEETILVMTGHNFGEWTQVKAPTTEEVGLEERLCANCGDVKQRNLAKLEATPTEPDRTEPDGGEQNDGGGIVIVIVILIVCMVVAGVDLIVDLKRKKK